MGLNLVHHGLLVTAAFACFGCPPPVSESPDAGGGDAPATVTYTKDVKPIFMAKCAPCHTGQSLGNHNVGTTFADALKPIESVDSFGCWGDQLTPSMPKKVGECALILIMNGRMPSGAGCGSVPPLVPEACLTSEQKAVIAAWIAAGLPE